MQLSTRFQIKLGRAYSAQKNRTVPMATAAAARLVAPSFLVSSVVSSFTGSSEGQASPLASSVQKPAYFSSHISSATVGLHLHSGDFVYWQSESTAVASVFSPC